MPFTVMDKDKDDNDNGSLLPCAATADGPKSNVAAPGAFPGNGCLGERRGGIGDGQPVLARLLPDRQRLGHPWEVLLRRTPRRPGFKCRRERRLDERRCECPATRGVLEDCKLQELCVFGVHHVGGDGGAGRGNAMVLAPSLTSSTWVIRRRGSWITSALRIKGFVENYITGEEEGTCGASLARC